MTDNGTTAWNWINPKFLIIFFCVQLVIISLTWLPVLGLAIPIIPQIAGVLFITFVPGLCLLFIFRANKIDTTEILLYSVGLSVAFIMLLGLLINAIYPSFGLPDPISLRPMLITISVITILLDVGVFLTVRRSKDATSEYDFSGSARLPSAPILFLILIPVLSILGTQLVNDIHNNIVLLVLICVIAAVPIIAMVTNFIPASLYPLAVLSIAIALLFHISLIASYLTGSDINIEYGWANMVISNSAWDSTIASAYNLMASITILAPVYSLVCGIDLQWVFKIIYPLLFSLVPLGIYFVAAKQVDKKIAFLASFFFMAVSPFYVDMNSLARQQIGELFIVLIMASTLSVNLGRTLKTVLCLLFGIALIVSHYSLTYIFIFFLVISLAGIYALKKLNIDFSTTKDKQDYLEVESSKPDYGILGSTFVAFFIVTTLAWYIWLAHSITFAALVKALSTIMTSFVKDFFNLDVSNSLWLMTQQLSFIHQITRLLHFITIFLIGIGILYMVFTWRKRHFKLQYAFFSLASFLLAMIAVVTPYLTISINTTRLYQISLIFLAPFCILGTIAIYISTFKLFKRNTDSIKVPLVFMSLVLLAVLLFNSGFVYEIFKDDPTSIAFSQETIHEYSDPISKDYFYGSYIMEQDIWGAKWLSQNVGDNSMIYATFSDPRWVYVLEVYGGNKGITIPLTEGIGLPAQSYVYLKYVNVVERLATEVDAKSQRHSVYDIGKLENLWVKSDKIYANSGSEIYMIR